MEEKKSDKKDMKVFMESFEKEIIPVIKGKDGKGLATFRTIVEAKREAVEKRKAKRKTNRQNEGGDNK